MQSAGWELSDSDTDRDDNNDTASTVRNASADLPKRVDGVPVEKVLGENRLIYLYVVYRTTRFHPDQGTKESKKVRCTEHYSKQRACMHAQGLFNRPIKGVVNKEFDIADGFLRAVVRFKSGELQHFWVEREMKSVMATQKAATRANAKQLKIDPGMFKVYRERFDVVSFKATPNFVVDEEEDDRPIECDGDQEDDEDGQPAGRPRPQGLRLEVTNLETPLDLMDWEVQLHKSFTSVEDANLEAVRLLTELLKPANRRMEDNHYYQYTIKPSIAEAWRAWNKSEPFAMEWTPSMVEYRFEFLQARIKVVRTELCGPVDIGDMVIEHPDMAEEPDDADRNGDREEISQVTHPDIEMGEAVECASAGGDEDVSDISEEP